MAHVQLQNLTKSFGPVEAVADLSLEVPDGELLVVVGPSGCGKTTLLRLIAGLETPTAGRVHIGAADVTDAPPASRNVAMAFQDHALYPHLTVYDNLAFALRLRGGRRAEFDGNIREMLARLHLAELAERHPDELSAGQRQRVALGRALVRRPSCCLLDEPLGSLDEALRAELRELIRDLHRELRTTMIFVTHDQQEAMLLGERIAVLDAGRLLQCDEPEQVYRGPATARVAALVGAPPMNLIAGRLAEVDGGWQFQAGDWQLPLPRDVVALRNADELSGSREVVLGIRPPALRLTTGDAPAPPDDSATPTNPARADQAVATDEVTIPVRLRSAKLLGAVRQFEVELPCGDAVLAQQEAATDPSSLAAGDACQVRVAASELHLFDAGSGRRLLARGPSGARPPKAPEP
ncbi:MAG: ABC transporter ATP-binding protein [Planctomycetota bacterium]|nr:MAG: ABC transporter ATP-binding protein [Planctomycetota bacterium]